MSGLLFILSVIFWSVVAVIFILAIIFRFKKVKGAFAEKFISFFIYRSLDKNVYHILDDVMLPDDNGGSTQIDHIVLSPFGIFVIETKNYKGWIYGKVNEAYWTQKFPQKSFRLANPFRQNYKHICCLSRATGLPEEVFINTVVILGINELKINGDIPPGLTSGLNSLVQFIKSHKTPIISEQLITVALERIHSNRIENTTKNRRGHMNYVRNLAENKTKSTPCIQHNSYSTPDAANAVADTMICPRCGSTMVLRKAQKGNHAGNTFWGCSKYPQCRCIINITEK